jgi:hypothetical protein
LVFISFSPPKHHDKYNLIRKPMENEGMGLRRWRALFDPAIFSFWYL